MSRLIERMIQRTRGPLSSLEPVAVPAFAASDQSGLVERTSQTVVNPAASGPRPDPGQPVGVRAAAPRTGTTAVKPDPDQSPAPATSEGAVATRTQSPVAAQAPAIRAPGTPPHKQPGEEPASAGRLPAASRRTDRDDREPVLAPMARIGNETDQEPGSRPVNPEIAVSAPVPVADSGHMPVVAHSPQAQRQAPSPPGALEESQPEITISIGHIEVRSEPTVVPQVSLPAFRPKVSLADFLSRDRRP